MRKWFIALVLIIAFVMEGCGNAVVLESNSKDINALAKEYLEERYGETFTYIGPWDQGFRSEKSMRYACDAIPGSTVLVVMDKRKEGGYDIYDNYLAWKYDAAVKDKVGMLAAAEFGAASVLSTVPNRVQKKEIPADATFEEYLSLADVPLSLTVEVPDKAFTDLEPVRRLAAAIDALGPDYQMSVVSLGAQISTGLTYAAAEELINSDDYIRSALISRMNGQAFEQLKEGNRHE